MQFGRHRGTYHGVELLTHRVDRGSVLVDTGKYLVQHELHIHAYTWVFFIFRILTIVMEV